MLRAQGERVGRAVLLSSRLALPNPRQTHTKNPSSSGVYGLVGLCVLSIAVNHETMPLWWLRLAAMVLSICFMIAVAAAPAPGGGAADAGEGAAVGAGAPAPTASPPARSGTSHLSHLGGFLTGLFAAFLFLPNFKDRRWRGARRVAKRLGRAFPAAVGGSGGGGGSSAADGGDGGGSAQGGGAEQRGHLGGLAASASCWRVRRPLFRAMAALSVATVVFFMLALPLYAWTSLLPGLTCPDEDAMLAMVDAPVEAADAAAGAGAGAPADAADGG